MESGESAEHGVVELLVGGEVGRHDADDMVGVAEETPGLDDLRELGYGGVELRDGVRAL
jgi:hypothetical protein